MFKVLKSIETHLHDLELLSDNDITFIKKQHDIYELNPDRKKI